MKPTYNSDLIPLRDWIRDINNLLKTGHQVIMNPNDCFQIQEAIQRIAHEIKYEYSFLSSELYVIQNNLFNFMVNPPTINTASFGELFLAVEQIINEPINTRFWNDIHPDIVRVSKALYCDGHFGAAADKAVIEIETKMRKLFRKYKPGAIVPKDSDALIDALLSDNGLHHFCDTTEKSGQNYRKGIHQLFKGAFLAYRHPNLHENLPCTQQEAFGRIVLASQLMFVLTAEVNP